MNWNIEVRVDCKKKQFKTCKSHSPLPHWSAWVRPLWKRPAALFLFVAGKCGCWAFFRHLDFSKWLAGLKQKRWMTREGIRDICTSTWGVSGDKHGGVAIRSRRIAWHIGVLVHFRVEQLALLHSLKHVWPGGTAICFVAEPSTGPNRPYAEKGISNRARSPSVAFIGNGDPRYPRSDESSIRIAVSEVAIVGGRLTDWVDEFNWRNVIEPAYLPHHLE